MCMLSVLENNPSVSNLEVLDLRRSGTRHEPVFLCQDTEADSRHGTRRGSLEVSTDQLDALHVACQIDRKTMSKL